MTVEILVREKTGARLSTVALGTSQGGTGIPPSISDGTPRFHFCESLRTGLRSCKKEEDRIVDPALCPFSIIFGRSPQLPFPSAQLRCRTVFINYRREVTMLLLTEENFGARNIFQYGGIGALDFRHFSSAIHLYRYECVTGKHLAPHSVSPGSA